MLNHHQLLELVIETPDRSAVDMRFLTSIWEAMTKWCTEQFDQRVGVKLLGLGEFCFRKDMIGEMEFWNPMFIISEAFARSHGLHDRRPKTHAAETESIELDMSRIAQMTTDLLGEVVGREVVDAALRDVVDRLGEVCANDKEHGVVIVDFGFGKLISENKSVEFTFGDTKAMPLKSLKSLKAPSTSSGRSVACRSVSGRSVSGRPTTSTMGSAFGSNAGALAPDLQLDVGSVPGLSMTKQVSSPTSSKGSSKGGRAPLQRPYVRHLRPQPEYSMDEVLKSHEKQLADKAEKLDEKQEVEAIDHLQTLQRLRGEMVMDYELREARSSIARQLADQQKQQNAEKRVRDAIDSKVLGIDHWPFRTEDEIRDETAFINAKQKEDLDRQLKEKQERRAKMEEAMRKRQMAEEEAGVREMLRAQDDARLRAKAMQNTQRSVDGAIEDAFSRYEGYLDRRKSAQENSSSFLREQRHLTEQAEVLKQEENRLRMAEMKAYLAKQAAEKRAKLEEERQKKAQEPPISMPRSLPSGVDVDPDEEAYVKMAIKRALDHQVDHKTRRDQKVKEEELAEQKHVLNVVAEEMQQIRFRDAAHKREQSQMLSHMWSRQNHLRSKEIQLDRSEP